MSISIYTLGKLQGDLPESTCSGINTMILHNVKFYHRFGNVVDSCCMQSHLLQ